MRQAFLIAAIVLFVGGITLAEVPKLISYQGRFSDAGTSVADGTYPIAFTIYDQATGGTVLWTETQNVTVTNGLFSVLLGAVNPVTTNVFSESARYLGVKLGGNPELAPRPRLAAVPYALTADSARTVGDKFVKLEGDTMSGPLSINNGSSNVVAKLGAFGTAVGALELLDDGKPRIDLEVRPNGGLFTIDDSTGQDQVELFGNGSGGQLRLYNSSGDINVLLDGSGSGSALLPLGSVSSKEIFDEPGIEYAYTSPTVVLTTTMSDIVTVDIVIPASGYVYVSARGVAYLSGTTGTNYGYAQIDETEGGSVLVAAYRTVFGAESFPATGSSFWPFSLTHVYQKSSAGTYTFRLEGRCGGAQGSGASIDVRGATIEAIFIPTRY
jgi:hypothetical protein